MPSTSTIFRAARPAFRSQQFFTSQQAQSQLFRTTRNRFQNYGSKRWQSTAAPAAEQQVGWFKRIWDSPIGIKTVHFWAPVMKWAIVLAGIGDFYRPVEKLSLTQNVALTATGLIWTRWCLIIKPRNILLATVNFFLGLVGLVQVSRIASYNYSQKDKAATEQLEEVKDGAVDVAEGLKKDAIEAVKS
ncbi:related to FMP43 Found in Mitochondrial Proteome [Phialocephala subalpina]|uniref:Mitochondrial pyruvate carrier n=1 Tax=Phialocephala subalpina TaxID=576137 RepID=A0A1L7WFU2_9HELO|nr:related to FMP43 Found in Mitochondrial Proteome [Phialocephala subalpina]